MPVKRIININLPGSKSYTNRALICAALANGRTRLFGFGECKDTLMMMKALKKMGIKLHVMPTWHGKTTTKNLKLTNDQKYLDIRGGLDKLRLPKSQINVGNAGTAMRFVATLIGLAFNRIERTAKSLKFKGNKREIALTGSKRMCERPIVDLLEALGELGIQAESVKRNGCPPIIIQNSTPKAFGAKLKVERTGGRAQLKGNASSQYLSSILLCAPYFNRDTEIEIIGELTSKPYVDMTIQTMQDFGVKVENRFYRHFYIKAGQKYQPQDYQIEPDASAASYFMAGAALTGQTVRFPGLSVNSKQGDVDFARVLAKSQKSKVKSQKYKLKGKSSEGCLEFHGTGNLQGIMVDMNDMPDIVPTLAVLAMFAKGRTVIRNVTNLRIKETDRLRALAVEIRKFSINVKERKDGLEINGDPEIRNTMSCRHGMAKYEIRISTYNDHRMAMAFAVAKLVLSDIIIENPECTAKSFPKFWNEWHKICIPSL